MASLLRKKGVGHARRLSLVPYSTWLECVERLGGTATESLNDVDLEQHNTVPADGNEKTTLGDPSLSLRLDSTMHAGKNYFKDSNPAYNLLEFFATDFRRMACGSVVLETHLALEASPTLRDFVRIARVATTRDQILDRYIGYWHWCGYL